MTALHLKKKGAAIKCGEPGSYIKLTGLKRLRGTGFKKTKKRERTVSRPYGGCLSGKAVRDRIIRAFLIEEVKIVKRVMKTQSKKEDK